jgi:hypothetical protein
VIVFFFSFYNLGLYDNNNKFSWKIHSIPQGIDIYLRMGIDISLVIVNPRNGVQPNDIIIIP